MRQKKEQPGRERQAAAPGTRVDSYISAFPKEIRARLEVLREAIREAAPSAMETISYGIPTFDLNGRHLVHFAAFKKHIGFFPTPSGIGAFREELAEYDTSKGTIRFPPGKSIPIDLVKRIISFRVGEVEREER
jgi:uncharacterized protein YdhG (YjbR/CyaY superfamily)